ncbi:MAG: bifunctional diaminohydroxyphosphoribosylaminopyrimidine deaminase/5-amino-6-(5-phosphoribosylamino)uracil reductase RibD [Candidatus Omnitrophota bacterium]
MTVGKHKQFMRRAIELARKAEGKTFPNPLVGALVVKKGKIVGEGHHEKPGSAHAEITALKKAKKSARKASLYISLEPCAHYGKTPPCVNSIIKSGIKRVYAAMKDPNPLVNGRGLNLLRRKGIEVKVGLCRREAEKLNKVYIESIRCSQE